MHDGYDDGEPDFHPQYPWRGFFVQVFLLMATVLLVLLVRWLSK